MDEYLLRLGMSDVFLRAHGTEKTLNQEETEKMMQGILDLELFISSIERKGISFREFLELKKEGLYPKYKVALGDVCEFLHTEEELTQFKKAYEEKQKQIHAETLASIPPEEITEEMKVFVPKGAAFVELFDANRLTQLLEKLGRFGVHLDQYLIATGVLFDLIEDGNKTVPLCTLKEVIDAIRVNGRKGVEVQRYKGLGEMNADQLWETTMDPKVRTLLNVTLPDAIAADRAFSMLMGEDVPPRREFIEKHALSVKNLDI
jgi:DNA gyrase subunit B